MFTMMNLERLSIGIQGIGLAEMSYQLSRHYALERKQGKSAIAGLSSIIEHADVRRMLLEQRCFTEPARALAVYMGNQIDLQYHHTDESIRKSAENLMTLLTPVAKAFFTDKGFDACNHGLQVLGGHGYIREWGLEQLVRDAKIAQIYEGTNGIQAQDLLVRKVCLDKQGVINQLYELIKDEITQTGKLAEAKTLQQQLLSAVEKHESTSQWLIENFADRSYEIQGGAIDYLHATGHLVYGWMWLKMLNSCDSELSEQFVARKKVAAIYFSQQILPNINQLCDKVKQGYKEVMLADSGLI